MPELPEVETTLRGLLPHLSGRTVTGVVLRRPDLRWPIPPEVAALRDAPILSLSRRAKYVLMEFPEGTVLWHLGMTGNMRVVPVETPVVAHDHVDFLLDNGRVLRFHDPRRFGAILWQPRDRVHKALAHLGPEPLSADFTGDYLAARARGRKLAVKPFLMSQDIVVGVGNIYANEALFLSGIAPARAAGRIAAARYDALAGHIKTVLARAIEVGGTTLRDFSSPDGFQGYFVQELAAYGRAGLPCIHCGTPLRVSSLGGRQTVWCPRCQR